jgi:hypothetical protein
MKSATGEGAGNSIAEGFLNSKVLGLRRWIELTESPQFLQAPQDHVFQSFSRQGGGKRAWFGAQLN